jgi:trimethylamine:corrinoid methyltransferase-like protein
MIKRARARAEEILRDHWPTPLEKDVQKEISEIISRAEKELPKSTL